MGQKEGKRLPAGNLFHLLKTVVLNAVTAAYRVGLRIAVAAGNIIRHRRYNRPAWVNTDTTGCISRRSTAVYQFHLGLIQVGNFCFVQLQAACIHFDLFHACLF